MRQLEGLGIASENKQFPWSFFYKTAKPQILLIIFTVTITYLSNKLFIAQNFQLTDLYFISKISIIIIIIYSTLLFWRIKTSKSIISIWDKISKIEERYEHEDKIQLHQQSDSWKKIELAIFDGENRFEKQFQNLQDEHKKTAILLESIADAIIAFDTHNNSLFFNDKFKNIFIPKSDQTNPNHKLWKIFNSKEIIETFNLAIENDRIIQFKAFEFIFQNKLMYFELTVSPLRNNLSQTIGTLAVFHDVTETKLSEKMRVDFVANISHEIRTPLTSIKGFAQMLGAEKALIPTSTHLYLDKIVANSERLISLFNDLLNLSVVDSTTKLNYQEIDLESLIDAISANIKSIYMNKKIIIQKDIQAPIINADEKLMYQVFTNLIDNACKYNGEAPIIAIQTFTKENKVHIQVSDNGHGIPSEFLERVFERFYRLETSRDFNLFPGTGIGLSLVKNIIHKHQGRVWAQNKADGGIIFNIELPN